VRPEPPKLVRRAINLDRPGIIRLACGKVKIFFRRSTGLAFQPVQKRYHGPSEMTARNAFKSPLAGETAFDRSSEFPGECRGRLDRKDKLIVVSQLEGRRIEYQYAAKDGEHQHPHDDADNSYRLL
jgi:hypothetical protein